MLASSNAQAASRRARLVPPTRIGLDRRQVAVPGARSGQAETCFKHKGEMNGRATWR